MISQNQFLVHIIKAIEHAGIDYMISGSIGSSFHGQPRATNDADIVITSTSEQIVDFTNSLGSDYYVSQEAALQAVKHHTMFNVIHIQTGYKADLIIRKNRPYSLQEFARRAHVRLIDIDAYVLSPEDSILSKLEWTKGRLSEIQYNDALGVMKVQQSTLDLDYLRRWAKELGLKDALEQLIKDAGR